MPEINNQTAANTDSTAKAAAQTQVPTKVEGTSNTNYDEIFQKLDSILDKRSEGLAKSALKDNGYEDSEMKDILSKYRASKENKSKEFDSQISTLETENAKLKTDLQNEKIEKEAIKIASDLEVEGKTVPYLIKMADFSQCFDEKGALKEDAVKTALEKVLTDIPSLKSKKDGTTGVTVGASTTNAGEPGGSMFGFNFNGVRAKN